MRTRHFLFLFFVLSLLVAGVGAQPPAPPRVGLNSIDAAELKDWLSYIASDQLQGRQLYTEGLGLAAAYIADHLKAWGVKPGGEDGSYFQSVRIRGIRTSSRASVTLDVNGETRTFKDGEGITFPRNMGGKQVINGEDMEFVGYGLQIPSVNMDDYANADPKGKVIVYLGNGPRTMPQGSNRLVTARA
jgi:hypothetical protein